MQKGHEYSQTKTLKNQFYTHSYTHSVLARTTQHSVMAGGYPLEADTYRLLRNHPDKRMPISLKLRKTLCPEKFLRIYTKLCRFSQFSWFNL